MSDTNETTAAETPDATNHQTNKEPKKWTVMVYLAGDNNLSDECVFAISEMKRSMLDKNVNVIIQLETGVFDNVRLRIKHGDSPGEIRQELMSARDEQEKAKRELEQVTAY